MKIKIGETYDNNVRALNTFDVKMLQDALEALAGHGAKNGLIKEGVIFNILKETLRSLPFRCDQCDKTMRPLDNSTSHNKCVCCQSFVCLDCSRNYFMAVCTPCRVRFSDVFETPVDLYRANFKKKNETVIDPNESLSISQIYPCAQSTQAAQGRTFAEVLQDNNAHVDAIVVIENNVTVLYLNEVTLASVDY